MKRLILAVALIAFPFQLQADAPEAPAEPAATVTEAAPAATAEAPAPEVGELLKQTGQVVSDWRTVGWLAGMIALINLLINLMRLPFLDALLARYKKKWLKPLVAAGLGALLVGLSSYATDANVLNSIVVGLMAGFAAVGVHEAAEKRKAENREA